MKLMKFFAAAALTVVLAASCNSQKPVDGVNPPSAALADSADYYMGVIAADILARQGMLNVNDEINMAQFIKGFNDFKAALGANSQEEFEGAFRLSVKDLNGTIYTYMNERTAYKAAFNNKAGKDFLAKNALKANVDTLPSGLQYTIEASGNTEKMVTVADTVIVNYKGTLVDGTVFDQQDTLEMSMAYNIEGWKQGVSLVGEGGKIKLFVPSELGYGAEDRGKIGPNSVLIFDIEVLEVKKAAPAEEAEEVAAE